MPLVEILVLYLILSFSPTLPPFPKGLHQPSAVCNTAKLRMEMLPPSEQWSRQRLCDKIASMAEQRQVDVPLMVELSWAESNWTYATNKTSGCIGPLQAQPRFWCPKGKAEGCDTIRAGLDAYTTLLKIYKTPERALCHYFSGNNCTPATVRAAHDVVRRANLLRRQMTGSDMVAQVEERREQGVDASLAY